MVTRPNWMAPFHMARATASEPHVARRFSGPAHRQHHSALKQLRPLTTALSGLRGPDGQLRTRKPSSETVGRPDVPLTRNSIVCVPATAQFPTYITFL